MFNQYTSSKYSSNNTDTTGEITLTPLASQLASGPIFIGESHSTSSAREAVKQLIETGNVKKLFLELPNTENDKDEDMRNMAIYLSSVARTRDQDMEAMIVSIFNNMEGMTDRLNSSKMGNLIKAALDQGNIGIYFHDSPIEFHESTKFVIINGEAKSEGDAGLVEGVRGRNRDSKEIIERNNPGAGTVILAGHHHLDAQKIGEENTLQALLGYQNDRVFDLSK
jgi:hypothetical protein